MVAIRKLCFRFYQLVRGLEKAWEQINFFFKVFKEADRLIK